MGHPFQELKEVLDRTRDEDYKKQKRILVAARPPKFKKARTHGDDAV
jgi:hypothetical protein